MNMTYKIVFSDSLYHHGIKGQKWGIRRYQNEDGSLTEEGKKRYGDYKGLSDRELANARKKAEKETKWDRVGAALGMAPTAALSGALLAGPMGAVAGLMIGSGTAYATSQIGKNIVQDQIIFEKFMNKNFQSADNWGSKEIAIGQRYVKDMMR